MKKNETNIGINASKQYSNFAGLLTGFSITFITLLLTLSSQTIKNNILFEYTIAAFIISAFAFLESSEFFIYFMRNKEDKNYEIASIFYYIGYLSMIFGVIYILKLFNINYALWISYLFLMLSLIYVISDYIKAILLSNLVYKYKYIFQLVLIIIYSLVFFYTLLN